MTYIFLGPDYTAKEKKITEIKEKLLPSPEAIQFDFEVLYASKLESEQLKKSLLGLPAVAKQRLVMIRECHKFNEENKELILEFTKKPGACVLILDSDKADADSEFIKKLGRSAKISVFGSEEVLNVFTMTRAISVGKKAEALKILSQLLSRGERPLQIMGGLVWYWKNSRRDLSLERFKKGLLALQEADLNIKRSRLKEEHALELLVVKLCSEEAC